MYDGEKIPEELMISELGAEFSEIAEDTDDIIKQEKEEKEREIQEEKKKEQEKTEASLPDESIFNTENYEKAYIDITDSLEKHKVSKHNIAETNEIIFPCYVVDISGVQKKEEIAFSILANVTNKDGDAAVYIKTDKKMHLIGQIEFNNAQMLYYLSTELFEHQAKVYVALKDKFKEYKGINSSVISLSLSKKRGAILNE